VGPSSAAPSLRFATLRSPRLLAPAQVSGVACFPAPALPALAPSASLRGSLAVREAPGRAGERPYFFFSSRGGVCVRGVACVSLVQRGRCSDVAVRART